MLSIVTPAGSLLKFYVSVVDIGIVEVYSIGGYILFIDGYILENTVKIMVMKISFLYTCDELMKGCFDMPLWRNY